MRRNARGGWAALAVAGAVWTAGAAAAAGTGSAVYVVRWTSLPDMDPLRDSPYGAWSRSAIGRAVTLPGPRELRTFRTAIGGPQIVTTIEFDSLASLAAWRDLGDVRALHEEAGGMTYGMETEVWGPSPALPAPRRRPGAPAGEAGRVCYVIATDVHPRKAEAYAAWVRESLPVWLSRPGLLEVRAWRVTVGARTEILQFFFDSASAWGAWYQDEACQRTRDASRVLLVAARSELWGPNPFVPRPVRPGRAD